ncbi:TetR/AcrR family transcriptional regulator [Paenibacillus sp. NPDC058177]|uniref:TetR/AcrR family transcriptional regulator n=1 Tax=Paenibacillus sp. NPDC058177 TaxID=3346369 RepID=UPI0036D826AF
MAVTKQEVLRSACRLFKERGFLTTSIQDIADDCQIAKGSVYKYFSSKEDLFSEVFDACQNDYFDMVENLQSIRELSPKEKLLQQIVLRFRCFIEYKRILVDFTELPIQQDPTFAPLRERVRGRLMMLHRDCLLAVYGEPITPFLTDLVFIYKAILKEYLYWLIDGFEVASIEETAQFIVQKVDVLADSMLNTKAAPLMPASMLQSHPHWGFQGKEENRQEAIQDLIAQIGLLIEKIPAGNTTRKELQELLHLFGEEMSKAEPSVALGVAILTYLEKENEIKSRAVQLKNMIQGAFYS